MGLCMTTYSWLTWTPLHCMCHVNLVILKDGNVPNPKSHSRWCANIFVWLKLASPHPKCPQLSGPSHNSPFIVGRNCQGEILNNYRIASQQHLKELTPTKFRNWTLLLSEVNIVFLKQNGTGPLIFANDCSWGWLRRTYFEFPSACSASLELPLPPFESQWLYAGASVKFQRKGQEDIWTSTRQTSTTHQRILKKSNKHLKQKQCILNSQRNCKWP
jgi:hypothetical protein